MSFEILMLCSTIGELKKESRHKFIGVTHRDMEYIVELVSNQLIIVRGAR
jgi:hypothetical protein